MTIRLLLALLAVVLVLPSLAAFYTEWIWFGEVGYRPVFLRILTTRFLLGGVAFLVGFAIVWGNLRYALTGMASPYLTFGQGADFRPIVIDRRRLGYLALFVAGVAGALAAAAASAGWLTWLQFLHATPFEQPDPLFGRDPAFYVFALPVYDLVRQILSALVLFSLVGAVAVYILAGAVNLVGGTPTAERRPRQHLSILAAAVLLLLAWGAYLDIPRLLVTPSGVIYGASYTDVEARLPALWVQFGVLVIGAGLAVWHAFTRSIWPIPAAIGLYVLALAGGGVYATAVQRLEVDPNEQEREAPFIEHNIAATRAAFALDAVETRELSGNAALTWTDIQRNSETIQNVRLWDHQPLLDTFGQIQEIRTYYDFVSVDNDRYFIDGEYRQTMLSARELSTESLPNRTWPNEHLTFTHGYGVALGPVNQVTPQGLPVLFIQDLPPRSSVDLEVTEPSIYYGELSNDYALVSTQAREFHYPRGEDNVYADYEGNGGVPIGGLLNRLLFSIRFRAPNILLSDQLSAESRILIHRRIADRISNIAPFLVLDPDPYLVIADGRLFWIADAYTTTRRYPYSTPASRDINYIRNSVKVVVDAYDGTTTFYLADPNDPLARTVDRMFPGLLTPIEEMPPSLRQHVRYPAMIFSIQTVMHAIYHMTSPAIFYNREDQWEIPSITEGGRPTPMEPYYTIMKLPDEDRAEFIQMLPFTPRAKDNLTAWMVARSDGEHYGKLAVYQFPKQEFIFGPRQIVSRISQDQVIAPQITLWNQQGSEVIQGTLLVIPIEESLLYIRPLYLRASGGQIPELKRVIVAYQNQIVMEETLEESLRRLFGARGQPMLTDEGPAPAPAVAAPAVAEVEEAVSELEDLAARARAQYDRAVEAQRQGDWNRYGDELRRLGETLEEMSGQPPR